MFAETLEVSKACKAPEGSITECCKGDSIEIDLLGACARWLRLHVEKDYKKRHDP